VAKESPLAPLLIAGGLLIGGVLATVLCLLLAGFLGTPFILFILIAIACLAILGVSIGAFVLWRGKA
jgi:hypothetical protein